MNPQPVDPDDDDIADVHSLFGDDSPAKRKAPGSSPGQGIPIGDGYEVEGVDPDEDFAPPPRAPAAPRRAAARTEPEDEEAEDVPERAAPEGYVEEVWSRWGEWGPTLMLLTGVAALTIVVFYLTLSVGFGPAFLALVLGFVIFLVLSYPIAVTLERPVRMTPEQALKDYFTAASHHYPHYRRMWLLLSATGKSSPEFFSFAEFQSYWKRRLRELRGDRVKSNVPLVFEIVDFESEKSGGKDAIEAEYTVTVRPRGESTEPLARPRISGSFVRGPDRMWYLNSGTLPDTAAESRGTGRKSKRSP